MSKKNKDIEVKIEETQKKINGQTLTVNTLIIGKKEIGQVVVQESKKFAVMIDDRHEATVKTLDEAIEYIIRQWNLND
ncbi:DUF2969 domain-containing protein [Candidatus Enterococcus mansonii]|uniref:DUF2969 domain-containing protein n=1 Tax=Candidatus Enterococcus mansonii TaxID=1834181 RepID=A0A242C623_9ENTE|nr:DUF2969 domain-containing protein [Enterococcus sp. 4G2_DIV0659]OTO05641.1 hypothetical protein A5880_002816 [Enterococcus sp. 4G2_DIV0659]